MPEVLLNQGHIDQEDFVERMTAKQWRQVLLAGRDTLIVKGKVRRLKAKNLGCGVVEVTKVPLKALRRR